MINENKADSSFESAAMRIIIQPLIDEELKAFDAYNAIPHEYSPAFQIRLKKLLNKYRFIELSRRTGLWCKRAAVCLMLIITVTFISCAAIEPLREKIADAFITWYSEYVSVYFSSESSHTELQKIVHVPAGYTLLGEVENEGYYIARYINDSDDLLTYTIAPHDQNAAFYDKEHHTIEQTSIAATDGIFFRGETGFENILAWSANGYDYSIVGFIDLAEMKKMVEGE